MFEQSFQDDLLQRGAKYGTSSMWDSWLPRSMLAVTFTPSSKNTTAVAAEWHSSHTFVRDIRAAIASVYIESQQCQVAGRVGGAEPHHKWLVLHLQWDDTRFTVKLENRAPAPRDVMTQHGMVHWETAAGAVESQELVIAPRVVTSKSADNMIGAINLGLHGNLPKVWESSKLCTFSPSIDSVSANTLVCKYFNSILPPHVLMMPSYCMQHQTALVMSLLTVLMGFIGPMFCTVRIVQQGAHLDKLSTEIEAILAEELEVDRVHAPSADNLLKVCGLVELCYAGADRDGENRQRNLRREEGDEICAVFNGDISAKRIVHHCRPGCCPDRAASVRRAARAIMTPLRRRLGVPALNRWLQTFPVVCVLLLLWCIHDLLPRAEQRVNGAAVRTIEKEAAAHADDDDGPGDCAAYRRENNRRAVKMMRFFGDPMAKIRIMLWTCVASPLMTIHYTLFARGTLYGWEKTGESALMELCRLPSAIAMKVLSSVGCAFDIGSAAFYSTWRLACLHFGPIASWPLEYLREADAAVAVVVGGLFRRFYIRLRTYPWRLAVIVDRTPGSLLYVGRAGRQGGERRCRAGGGAGRATGSWVVVSAERALERVWGGGGMAQPARALERGRAVQPARAVCFIRLGWSGAGRCSQRAPFVLFV